MLVTGDGLRHHYVAQQLAASLPLLGVVYEKKAKIVAKREELPPDDQRVISRHLDERDAVEQRLLREVAPARETPSLRIDHGDANSQQVFNWVRAGPTSWCCTGAASLSRHFWTSTMGRW